MDESVRSSKSLGGHMRHEIEPFFLSPAGSSTLAGLLQLLAGIKERLGGEKREAWRVEVQRRLEVGFRGKRRSCQMPWR